MNHLIFGGVVMKKLLSFLLSSIILMGSSVVTLAETSVDTEITNSNNSVEIKPNISMKSNSLNSSGNDNTFIEIKSSGTNGFDFALPENSLIYTWSQANLKKEIKLNDSVSQTVSSGLKFVNRSDKKRKVELNFNIDTGIQIKSGEKENVIEVTISGIKLNGTYDSTNNIKSYEIDLPIGSNSSDVTSRTVSVSVDLNLSSIDFNSTISETDVSAIISSGQTKPLFTLTISLVPETASGS